MSEQAWTVVNGTPVAWQNQYYTISETISRQGCAINSWNPQAQFAAKQQKALTAIQRDNCR